MVDVVFSGAGRSAGSRYEKYTSIWNPAIYFTIIWVVYTLAKVKITTSNHKEIYTLKRQNFGKKSKVLNPSNFKLIPSDITGFPRSAVFSIYHKQDKTFDINQAP